MTDRAPSAPSVIPAIADTTFSDIFDALREGWRDFRIAPAIGLSFSLVYVVGGLLIVWAYAETGQSWWVAPVITGFPILAPFSAVGLYETSRRIERGEPLKYWEIAGLVMRQRSRQLPWLGAIIVVFFLFWLFVAHVIFALFMGMSALTNISTSFESILTREGITMLVVGTVIGAGFALALFCSTVVSLPMLLDLEVDFITAIITSFAVVLHNPVTMLGWAIMIALILFVAMVPAFAGLFLALPVLGHASWHLYRRALPKAA